MTDREKELAEQLAAKNEEIARLHNALVDLRLDQHDARLLDHENRVRSLEIVATRSNVIFAITTSGGLVSIIVLFRTLMAIP